MSSIFSMFGTDPETGRNRAFGMEKPISIKVPKPQAIKSPKLTAPNLLSKLTSPIPNASQKNHAIQRLGFEEETPPLTKG
jgi:hypothetical protein